MANNGSRDGPMDLLWQCNNTGSIPKANPRDLVREGGPIIIVLYTFAALVVIALFILNTRYFFSKTYQDLSQPYRPGIFFITILPWGLCLFSSVTLMLPASHQFTVGIQRTFFAFILFGFLQITSLQMGGNKAILDSALDSKANKVFNWAASPFCCFMCFKGSKRPLTRNLFRFMKYLIVQMCIYQFFFLYTIMCLRVSDELGPKSYTTLQILQYVSWFLGIWGIGMLKDFVGNDLDDTKFNTRRKIIQGAANILIIQNALVVKVLDGAANIYPCYSQHISGSTIAALIDSTLIIGWCLLLGVLDHKIIHKIPMEIAPSQTTNAIEDRKENVNNGQSGIDNDGFV